MTPAKGDFAMTNPERRDQPVEERIGNLIGNIFCLLLLTFFLWAYGSFFAAQFGLFR
jgi:hypothetical protein